MQMVAGYFDLYMLRRTSEQSRAIAQSHQHVLQLATSVATSEGFQAAAMGLCNELATRAAPPASPSAGSKARSTAAASASKPSPTPRNSTSARN